VHRLYSVRLPPSVSRQNSHRIVPYKGPIRYIIKVPAETAAASERHESPQRPPDPQSAHVCSRSHQMPNGVRGREQAAEYVDAYRCR
jgi:hypothetical protein